MKLLLCNDDGPDTFGVCSLRENLSDIGEVWQLTPDKQQSGKSHAVHFHQSVILNQIEKRKFVLNGYPADCANVGMQLDIFPSFDLLVSGINHGPNLGDDVHYSGTVAAARQAVIHDMCAVAISSVDVEPSAEKMNRIASWLKLWLKENLIHLQKRTVYNINYPHESSSLTKEDQHPKVMITRQGRRIYGDYYQELKSHSKEQEKRGQIRKHLQLECKKMSHVKERNTDFAAIERGLISITPLNTDTTDIKEFRRWRRRKLTIELT